MKQKDFKAQLQVLNPTTIDDYQLRKIGLRLAKGLSKKLLADYLLGQYFGFAEGVGGVILESYLFALILFLDFSAYSDIAISCSRLMGIELPENFNRPYFSNNVQNLWQSWHISLMNWFRNYVFIPFQIALNRQFKGINYHLTVLISFSLVFVLSGLWHGLTMNYFLYWLLSRHEFRCFLFIPLFCL